MYKIVCYIPEAYVDIVKNAMFTAGAGCYDGYDCCCWQVKGHGQFRPLQGSNPFIGLLDEIETVDEYRVEMICAEDKIKCVLQEMIKAHPYEVPAYDVTEIKDLNDF